MRTYDYNKLLDARTFEYFGKAIIEQIENKRFEIFSEGKDEGIDLRNVENGFTTIVQVKRYKSYNSLFNQLKKEEIKKVQELKPDRYILITSTPISVSGKKKIKELFGEYILNFLDIIGCEELNSLLEKQEFKTIEDEYYQLWINSTRNLKNLIKKELNAATYAFTKDELDNIKQSTNLYVRHENLKKALRIIKNKRCLLISGEAGIGKSILARNLCAYLMNQNREIEFIYPTKLSEIPNLITEGKSQLFFIDDFWGSKFADNLKGEEENNLKRIIQIINKSNDKILILTSREYILSQGYAEYPELEEFFDNYKLKLYIEDYSELFKARILFKHLSKSQLNIFAIYQIANGYNYIIRNKNYGPRIIENYINYVSDKEIEPTNYLEDFKEYFPKEYELFYQEYKTQIISSIYNLTIDDAEFFMSDDMYYALDELKDITIPDLFETFNLKYTKKYMDSFYYATEGERLFVDKREDKKNLEILSSYINNINTIPKDSKEFFEQFLAYIINNNESITVEVMEKLKDLAYRTFKEGRNVIFKRELLEIMDEDIIESLEESGLIYIIRKKYYFKTIYLHLYLALSQMINKKDSLDTIYENFEYSDFYDLFYDICYTYSDINLEKFNMNFLRPQIDSIINLINDKDENKMIINLVKIYDINMDFDMSIDLEEEVIGYSTNNCSSLLALEYLGFDILDMVYTASDMEKIHELTIKAYKTLNISVDLAKDLDNIGTPKYQLLENLGIVKYLKTFCKHIIECSKNLKKNPNINLRKSFIWMK